MEHQGLGRRQRRLVLGGVVLRMRGDAHLAIRLAQHVGLADTLEALELGVDGQVGPGAILHPDLLGQAAQQRAQAGLVNDEVLARFAQQHLGALAFGHLHRQLAVGLADALDRVDDAAARTPAAQPRSHQRDGAGAGQRHQHETEVALAHEHLHLGHRHRHVDVQVLALHVAPHQHVGHRVVADAAQRRRDVGIPRLDAQRRQPGQDVQRFQLGGRHPGGGSAGQRPQLQPRILRQDHDALCIDDERALVADHRRQRARVALDERGADEAAVLVDRRREVHAGDAGGVPDGEQAGGMLVAGLLEEGPVGQVLADDAGGGAGIARGHAVAGVVAQVDQVGAQLLGRRGEEVVHRRQVRLRLQGAAQQRRGLHRGLLARPGRRDRVTHGGQACEDVRDAVELRQPVAQAVLDQPLARQRLFGGRGDGAVQPVAEVPGIQLRRHHRPGRHQQQHDQRPAPCPRRAQHRAHVAIRVGRHVRRNR